LAGCATTATHIGQRAIGPRSQTTRMRAVSRARGHCGAMLLTATVRTDERRAASQMAVTMNILPGEGQLTNG